ncbi:MAG: hypothetical protein QM811_29420 [Pirellulales bacterium]
MSLWLLIRRSLAFHWRMHTAVCLGVIVAGAVLTGALAIGDSMRGSLRGLVVDRLGRIDQALITPRFFRTDMATDFAKQANVDARPGIFMQAALTRTTDDAQQRVFAPGTCRSWAWSRSFSSCGRKPKPPDNRCPSAECF